MFGFIKKVFGKTETALPPGITMVDDRMAQLSAAAASVVKMQVMLGGLDDDSRQWTPTQRVTVMGYIDGYVSYLYPTQETGNEIPLCSLITAVEVLGTGSSSHIMDERESLIGRQDRTFVRAGELGWEDCKGMMSGEKRSPLGLVELLQPDIRG